ncbi:MAG: SDR family oxidoreductase [Thermoleophilia bacterium]|nr:SDR family oxidoreductase [Thermoleophilia bacterium]
MADLFRLDGKVAVVVGGGGGIGKALALGLARYGADVALASRNLEKLQKVAEEIAGDPEINTRVLAFQMDATDEASVKQAAQEILAALGTVDILVNAQGQNIKQPLEGFPVTDWDTLFESNVKSVMLCCREFGKIMLEKKKGKIINISSVAGDRGVPLAGNTGYCASKAAVSNFTRMLAYEWAKIPIHVNAIAPSVIFTEGMRRALPPEVLAGATALHPMGRVGEPEDLIGACVYLASAASDFMTGQILYVDGGRTCAA